MTMEITLNRIDPESERPMGLMNLPAFRVAFTSSTVSGEAMFIPATIGAALRPGDTFFVEVAQEAVSAIEVGGSDDDAGMITPLMESGLFRVCGKVTSIQDVAEPAGEQIFSATAGEAVFTLLKSEIANRVLALNDLIRFVAHDVSLWDEAI